MDELTDKDTATVLTPQVLLAKQTQIGILVEEAYELRNQANVEEDSAIKEFEGILTSLQ